MIGGDAVQGRPKRRMLTLGWVVAAIVSSPGSAADPDSDRANVGLCSPRVPEPASGGRVEGHVRWQDGSPMANVEVRASTGSRLRYAATSDATGSYALQVADDVFLEFRDARERVGAACFVRLAPPRVAILDVVLGRPGDDGSAHLGCQVGPRRRASP